MTSTTTGLVWGRDEAHETRLSQTDSVLEPDIMHVARSYVQSGGDINTAIQKMTDAYQGTPHMCNLVSSWFGQLGESEERVQEEVVDVLLSLVCKRFDQQKADAKFTKFTSNPEWLKMLVAEAKKGGKWKKTVDELFDQHPRSLLLVFLQSAIEGRNLIQKDTNEAQDTEDALLSDLQGFCDKLVLLVQGVHSVGESRVAAAVERLCSFCCQTDYTYIFTQRLFLVLAASNNFIFRSLSLALSEHAQKQGHQVSTMDRLLAGFSQYPVVEQAVEFLRRSGRLPLMHVEKLYEQFQPDAVADKHSPGSLCPPPVALLRRRELFEQLVEVVFTAKGGRLSPGVREKYVYLLAYCSCVVDFRNYLRASVETETIEKDLLDFTIAAINSVTPICCDANFGLSLPRTSEVLFNHAHISVIGAGLLHWATSSLMSVDYYTSTTQPQCTPILLALVARVAEVHVHLRASVLKATVTTWDIQLPLTMDPSSRIAFRQSLLRMLLLLLQLGLVDDVMSWLVRQGRSMDQALLRYFISECLDSVSGPYHSAFVNPMLRLLTMPSAKEAVRTEATSQAVVQRFAEEVQDTCLDNVDHDLHDAVRDLQPVQLF